MGFEQLANNDSSSNLETEDVVEIKDEDIRVIKKPETPSDFKRGYSESMDNKNESLEEGFGVLKSSAESIVRENRLDAFVDGLLGIYNEEEKSFAKTFVLYVAENGFTFPDGMGVSDTEKRILNSILTGLTQNSKG